MDSQKHFALIGAAGYVAPRHMKAIRETGNQLIAAYDPFDSVGVMDQYFPDADFFVEFERFDRHLEKIKRKGYPIDFVSICSPNYLHDAHIRFGLRVGSNVICEKPLVLNPWNIAPLVEIEQETGKEVHCILQLRLHPSVIKLREQVQSGDPKKIYEVDLTYLTARGNWYYTSWKGDESRSGGIATNIGIHFFDMLIWVFGSVLSHEVHLHTHDRASGYLVLERARVKWFLSINGDTIPKEIQQAGKRTFRALLIENQEFEFSGGFQDLHTLSYQQILSGAGFRIEDSRAAIEVVHKVRNSIPQIPAEENHKHPLADLPLSPHPFSSKSKNNPTSDYDFH